MLDDLKVKDLVKLVSLLKGDSETECPFLGQKVIVRTYSAGVHYGTLVSKNGKEVLLKNAIRIWQWYGACSLSQLAVDGTKEPDDCKFSVPVDSLLLTEAIEIIPCTATAIASIEGVTPWKK